MNLFVSIDGDSIGARVGQASLRDEVDETRRLSKLVNDGNAIFTEWALGVGGNIISAGGDEAVMEVEASHVEDLPALREKYLDLVGATVSVGVGLKLSEAQKALFVAKLEGKDRLQTYDSQVEVTFMRAREHYLQEESDEVEKLGVEYLQTQDRSQQQSLNKEETPDAVKGTSDDPHEKKLLDDSEAPHDGAKPEKKDWQKEFHAAAERQKTGGEDKQEQEELGALKQQVGVIVEGLRGKQQELAQLSQQDPELGQALNAMVQSMVQMGQKLFAEKVEKAEVDNWEDNPAQDPERHRSQGDRKGKPVAKVADEPDDSLDQEMGKTGPEGEIAPEAARPVPITEQAGMDTPGPVEKASLEPGKTGRHNVLLPTGSVKPPGAGGSRDVGKLKVGHASGKAGWQGVRAGLVGSPTGRPTSARNPGGAPQDKPGQTPEHYDESEAQPA